jgi:heme/copper-type cytochrome/quinol oxidase subunit 4
MATITRTNADPARSRDKDYLVVTWAVLMGLTAVSWWLGAEHALGAALSTTAILMVAFTKVLLVGRSFMELHRAAWLLQGTFAFWCIVTCTALIVLGVVL